ncbi:MAG TPA: ABC transporter substrate-binding protein, partial [Nonomuraea sp.]|nr:ABC transporter substrate-binding protein [Nonomuraea sp.]
KYNAQDALRACNAASKTAFLIIGGAGTDQIQACGQSQVLRRGNVPYLSSGVTETGLGSLPNYFATSLTYKQQSPLVIKMARDNGYLNKKWAMVITGTPNFADARESFAAELKKAGAQGKAGPFGDGDIYLTEKAPNNCVDVGTKLRSGGYESVYFLGQPLFFGQCVNQWPTATYTGPGPSFGIQSVADLACRGGASGYHAYYLHPAPDVAMSQQIARKSAPDTPAFKDDIESGIWGGMQGLEQAFNLVKGPLSRESFIAALAKAGTPGGVLNPAVYNGGSRFGGTGAYVNKITCNGATGVIKTIANYKK